MVKNAVLGEVSLRGGVESRRNSQQGGLEAKGREKENLPMMGGGGAIHRPFSDHTIEPCERERRGFN